MAQVSSANIVGPAGSAHDDKNHKKTMSKLKTMFGPRKPKSETGSNSSSPVSGPVSPSVRPTSPSVRSEHLSQLDLLVKRSNISPVSSAASSANSSSTTVANLTSTPSTTSLVRDENDRVSISRTASSASFAHGSRINITETGHEHHLKSTRRQERIGRMLRDIVGTGQKVRNDAVSAMPEFVGKDKDDLSLMSDLVSQIESGEKELGSVVRDGAMSAAQKSLLEKYGKCQEVIGKGAYGVVRVSHKYDPQSRREVLFAVKEFKRRPSEDEQKFSKRLTSEFCISSSLHHSNIIHTLDLMKDARGVCCQVMEYCAGGDLYSLILASEGGLDVVEADCFFKQIMRGVVYMHSMGVAHCDLKPENLLLTPTGAIKISDFGNGECFRMAWESDIHMSTGICGSRPYIAPEEFRDEEFDPRAVDMWATGIIYMAMRTGSYLWQVAIPEEDEFYKSYLRGRKHQNGYEPIESVKRSKCKNVIYSILDPIPSRRITGKQVLNSEWGRSIQVCQCGDRGY